MATPESHLGRWLGTHRFEVRPHLRERSQKKVAGGFADALRHLLGRRMDDREHDVHHAPCVIADFDEQLASVVRVGIAMNESPTFQRVEQRGNAAAGEDQSLRDDVRWQGLAGALDDGESLPRARGEIGESLPPTAQLSKE